MPEGHETLNHSLMITLAVGDGRFCHGQSCLAHANASRAVISIREVRHGADQFIHFLKTAAGRQDDSGMCTRERINMIIDATLRRFRHHLPAFPNINAAQLQPHQQGGCVRNVDYVIGHGLG